MDESCPRSKENTTLTMFFAAGGRGAWGEESGTNRDGKADREAVFAKRNGLGAGGCHGNEIASRHPRSPSIYLFTFF